MPEIPQRYVIREYTSGPSDGAYVIGDSREPDTSISVRLHYGVEVEGFYTDLRRAQRDRDRLNRAWWNAEGRQEAEDEEQAAAEAAANPITWSE